MLFKTFTRLKLRSILQLFIGYINPNPGLYSQTCAATFDLKPGRVVRKYPYDKVPNAYFVQIWDFGIKLSSNIH